MFNNFKSQKNKNNRILRWMEWVQKLLIKRGIISDIDSCAYGQNHLVSGAKPIGGGWMFYSKGCSGCIMSAKGLILHDQGKELPKGAPNCAILNGPLFSLTKVTNNKRVDLPFIQSEEKSPLKQILKTLLNEPPKKLKLKPKPPKITISGGGGGSFIQSEENFWAKTIITSSGSSFSFTDDVFDKPLP